MKTKTIELYSINELSEEAQKRAYESWYYEEVSQYSFQGENEDSLNKFCEHFNISWKEYDYSGYNNHIYFKFNQDEEIQNLEYVRLWKYLNNNNYEFIKWNNPESKYTINSKKTTIYDCCPFTGYCLDEDLLDPIRNFLKKPTHINFYELIDNCLDNWLKACYEDYKYQTSFEAFIEMSETNDYNYTEEGEMING